MARKWVLELPCHCGPESDDWPTGPGSGTFTLTHLTQMLEKTHPHRDVTITHRKRVLWTTDINFYKTAKRKDSTVFKRISSLRGTFLPYKDLLITIFFFQGTWLRWYRKHIMVYCGMQIHCSTQYENTDIIMSPQAFQVLILSPSFLYSLLLFFFPSTFSFPSSPSSLKLHYDVGKLKQLLSNTKKIYFFHLKKIISLMD